MAIQLPSNLPKTIKSILQKDPKSPALTLSQTPLILPSDTSEILIKVHATSPCAGELTWAANFPSLVLTTKLPIVCQDLSGQVVAAPSTSSFRPGDEVYARIPFSRPGAASEYVVAGELELALKPKNLNFLETAATPLSALTAWQALFVHGLLDAKALKGDGEAQRRNGGLRVLVTGATGGVGSWIVQLASLAGAGAIVGVVGKGKEEAARELGVTEVVNYRETSVGVWAEADASRECDLVIDGVGGDSAGQCWKAVKTGGVLLALSTDPNAVKPEGYQKQVARAAWFLVEPLGSNLAEITELIEAGKLGPTIDSVWAFEEYEKAFARVEDGHAKGKVIIKVDGEL